MTAFPYMPSLPPTVPSLNEHYYKRIALSRHWAPSTTLSQFEDDLRNAIADTRARFAVYERDGAVYVGSVTPNNVPPTRLGDNNKPYIYIVYSVRTGVLLSGYQIDASGLTALGGSPVWLP